MATSTSFIDFTFVNLAGIAAYVRARRAGRVLDPVPYVLAPAIGVAVDVYLLLSLDGKALTRA
ncbi:hypothetical protein [Streptomyces chromofuscus]|uniref:hypothetical protein n=1 Tax=Streptomyces chromofuscus TaxID=42881 RepID=UPI001E28F77B|nr:hypothetical protein [Streptomyces chromofuscus]